MTHPMIFAEDYLDFDRDEAQAEYESALPPLSSFPVHLVCGGCGGNETECECGSQPEYTADEIDYFAAIYSSPY